MRTIVLGALLTLAPCTLLQAQNVGIGTATPLEKLHVAGGNLRVDNLAGTGTRSLYTDPNGTMTLSPGTGAAALPSGTTAQQPATPAAGYTRYNTTLGVLEVYNGSTWMALTDGSGTLNYLARWTPDGSSLGTGATRDDGTNVGIGVAPGTFKLNVAGSIHGDKFVVQNAVNGTSAKGIYMWQAANTDWGIYMGESGAGLSLANGSAAAGAGFASHAIRIRTNASATQGFLVENNAEQLNFSLRGSDGLAYLRGNTGIGTTNPAEQLHVASASASAGIVIDGVAASQSRLAFRAGNTERSVIYRPAASNNLHFYGNGLGGDMMSLNTTNGDAAFARNITSPRWRVTQVYNNSPGVVAAPPAAGAFTTGGGTVILHASASGFRGGAGTISLNILVDGVSRGTLIAYTNEASSHKSMVANPLVITGLAAGAHTVQYTLGVAGTQVDFNDYFNLTVVEFPF